MTDFPEWQITCPWCHARPGQRCTSAGRGRPIAIPSHDARITTWTALQTANTKETRPT